MHIKRLLKKRKEIQKIDKAIYKHFDIDLNDDSIYFCSCPCCINEFQKSPEPLEKLIKKTVGTADFIKMCRS